MILDLFYVSLVVFAIIAIQTAVLRNAIIYLSVFSLLCSIVYLFLGAPDVAIAEAAIGCTLSTILYLVALKKIPDLHRLLQKSGGGSKRSGGAQPREGTYEIRP